ncbi:MAG: hypothetical protein WKF30_11785 [Pyrinomonadaceae bacterium]
MPTGGRVRVRGAQVYGQVVKAAFAGQRAALNLGGIEVSDLERGMVLAPPGQLRPTQMIDVRLEVCLMRRARFVARACVHAGTAEVLARVHVLEQSNEVAPGAGGLMQLRLETPIVAVTGDRFIIRSYSPSHTIAGGQVLDGLAGRYRGREKYAARERLAKLAHAETDGALCALFVEKAGERALSRNCLAAHTAWHDEALRRAAAEAKKAHDVIEVENYYISRASLDSLVAKACAPSGATTSKSRWRAAWAARLCASAFSRPRRLRSSAPR